MLGMKNFRQYRPSEDKAIELEAYFKVVFFISEDGQDWYQSQKDFSQDTLKVAYDERGIIRSLSGDISKIYPDGYSVAEVANTEENQKADIYGGWIYQGGKLSPRTLTPEELSCRAEVEKNALLQRAEKEIALLSRAVRLDMATQEDISLLGAWERYSIQVNKIDTSTGLVMDWPVKPE